MNFFKKLFEFLFHKDHVITKKVHTLGAVIVTTCIVSVMVLGVNGYASSMHNESAEKDQEVIANEEEVKEIEVLESQEDELVLQSDSNDYVSQTWPAYIDYMIMRAAEEAEAQVVERQLAINQDKQLQLSTSSGKATEDLVTFSGDDVDVTPNRDPIAITDSDYQVLLTIVEAEVGTEDLYTRMMIANTIINRMQHDYYPDTIEEVVFQNDGKVYQFSPILDGRYWEVKVSRKTVEAVNNALAGYDNSLGALAFVNRDLTHPNIMKWFDENLIFVTKYGKVEYFTF